MEVTDDERRRMARILRGGYDVVSDDFGRFWLNGALFGVNIMAHSEERIRDGLSRLADLVEPVRDKGEKDFQPNVTCDREALLALADELYDCGLDGWACGPVDVGGFACRIREACGEAVA